MRKVAKNAGLSLSNLQYHYKDKNLLLISTVEFYFESCKKELSHAIRLLSVDSAPDKDVSGKNIKYVVNRWKIKPSDINVSGNMDFGSEKQGTAGCCRNLLQDILPMDDRFSLHIL